MSGLLFDARSKFVHGRCIEQYLSPLSENDADEMIDVCEIHARQHPWSENQSKPLKVLMITSLMPSRHANL